MAAQLYATFMTQLRKIGNIVPLVDALEHRDRFRPTHYGPNEKAQLDYDRNGLLAAIPAVGEFGDIGLARRKKKPAYAGYFSPAEQGIGVLHLEFTYSSLSNTDHEEVYAWAEELASALTPLQFAFVHQVGQGTADSQYAASGRIDPGEFRSFGLKAVYARTWFGPHLIQILGRDFLRASPGVIRETTRGLVCLDLLDRPWQATNKELAESQKRMLAYLSPKGVFGDYSSPLEFKKKPGPKWTPIAPENE